MAPEHVFWITSRAAGIVALLASSAAVTLGLLMGGRMLRGRTVTLRATHEALSLATITAIVVHALALLGDGYLSPTSRTSRSRSSARTSGSGPRPASSPAGC